MPGLMKSTIKKWGNSAAIRIPAAVMKAVEFDLDEIVDVREEEGRIIIEAAIGTTTLRSNHRTPWQLRWSLTADRGARPLTR